MRDLLLRPMQRSDWPAVAELIRSSTNGWYEAHGKPRIFECESRDLELFCRVYEDLDPGCCILAEESDTDTLVGSCFYHPRPTHVSLGIMNSRLSAFGRGVAGRLLAFVVEFASRQRKPLRLVSSAMNLDSFSLYSRAGFVPGEVYQDMFLGVPESGFDVWPPGRERVRAASLDDVERMVALELELRGLDREKDFRYFLTDPSGIWHVSVLDGDGGRLDGFLVSVAHAASNMLGPGVMRDDTAALALVAAELDHHPGRTPVWLSPTGRAAMARAMYAWGARNCELHFAQVLGESGPSRGVSMPTFMPETG